MGLIGCGGRGNWIAPFFPEHTGARVVALADVVKDHLDSTAATFKVAASRAYYGPDAGRQLAQSAVDAVVIETPTYYHAEQAAFAVDAGKHVYMAKPVAVDVPGCKSVLASGKKAQEKKLTYWVDFQTRSRDVYKELATRVHRGDIGKPVLAQVFYYAGRPSKDRGTPGMDAGQRRMSNFYMDKVLGGDIIVEQNIHVIDVANWLLQGHPTKAYGSGGRTDWSGTPFDAGDAWDHFLVQYHYANNVHADFSSNQLTNSFSDLCVRVFGIDGCADSHYGGSIAHHREERLEGRGEGRHVQGRRGGKREAVHRVDSREQADLQLRGERAQQSHGDSGTHGSVPESRSHLGRDHELQREVVGADLKLRW